MVKEKFGTRLAHAWDAFMNKDPTPYTSSSGGIISTYRPDIRYVRGGNEKSVVTAVYDRIATDVSMLTFHHAEIDENGSFKKTIRSKLDTCLSLSANLDQTGRDLIKDTVVSMFDEGCIVVVPTVATINPKDTDAWMPTELRVGKAVNWYPDSVDVEIYNPYTGVFEQMRFNKKKVAIIQNPYYRIMNANGSVAKRLMNKLSLGDVFDERIASDKMNMVVQLPYAVSGKLKSAEANARIADMTNQMRSNPYGIAYIGSNEKITQLNRAIDNGIRDNIKELKDMFYALDLIESYGSGIRRAKEAMEANLSPDIVFLPNDDLGNYTNAIIYIQPEFLKENFFNGAAKEVAPEIAPENSMGVQITRLMRENPRITIKEIAQRLDVSVRGVKYNINLLKENGRIERRGSTKSGTWVVLK